MATSGPQAHLDHSFCRDAVVLQHTYELFSRSIELSVHDNVLLVHHLDSSTVLLLDVRARTHGPIVGPLPLAIALENQVSKPSMRLPVVCNTLQCSRVQCLIMVVEPKLHLTQ